METVELDALPLAEKLRLMEALWDSLCRVGADAVLAPSWHAEVLVRRAQQRDSGEEAVSAWEDAKQRIRKQARIT